MNEIELARTQREYFQAGWLRALEEIVYLSDKQDSVEWARGQVERLKGLQELNSEITQSNQ
jgi:hypothetical protein